MALFSSGDMGALSVEGARRSIDGDGSNAKTDLTRQVRELQANRPHKRRRRVDEAFQIIELMRRSESGGSDRRRRTPEGASAIPPSLPQIFAPEWIAEKHLIFQLFTAVVPRPGVEPGLALGASYDHYRPRIANDIEGFDDLQLYRVGSFCPICDSGCQTPAKWKSERPPTAICSIFGSIKRVSSILPQSGLQVVAVEGLSIVPLDRTAGRVAPAPKVLGATASTS